MGQEENRVFLPVGANQGVTSSIDSVNGLSGFIGAIFNSAKDWQDINQTVLPGYRERIVRLYLKPDEGGLNLSMSSEQIAALTGIGKTAGNEILNKFIFEEHRWRRLLSAYAAIEEGLEAIKEDYGSMDKGSMSDFLKEYKASYEQDDLIAKSYKPKDLSEIVELIARLDKLAKLASDLTGQPIRDNWGENGNMPRPSASLRVTPSKLLD